VEAEAEADAEQTALVEISMATAELKLLANPVRSHLLFASVSF
jgi:hypothetical protein